MFIYYIVLVSWGCRNRASQMGKLKTRNSCFPVLETGSLISMCWPGLLPLKVPEKDLCQPSLQLVVPWLVAPYLQSSMCVASLSTHLSLCLNFPFSFRAQWYWLGATLMTSSLLDHLKKKTLFPNKSRSQDFHISWGAIIQPITCIRPSGVNVRQLTAGLT